MKKLLIRSIGELKGTIYLANLGYVFRIRYKSKVVGRSIVYFKTKEIADEKMLAEMKELSLMHHDLFDKII